MTPLLIALKARICELEHQRATCDSTELRNKIYELQNLALELTYWTRSKRK